MGIADQFYRGIFYLEKKGLAKKILSYCYDHCTVTVAMLVVPAAAFQYRIVAFLYTNAYCLYKTCKKINLCTNLFLTIIIRSVIKNLER